MRLYVWLRALLFMKERLSLCLAHTLYLYCNTWYIIYYLYIYILISIIAYMKIYVTLYALQSRERKRQINRNTLLIHPSILIYWSVCSTAPLSTIRPCSTKSIYRACRFYNKAWLHPSGNRTGGIPTLLPIRTLYSWFMLRLHFPLICIEIQIEWI